MPPLRQTPGAQRPPRALSSQRSPVRDPAGTWHPQNWGWGAGGRTPLPHAPSPPSAPERLYPQLHRCGNCLPSPWQPRQSTPNLEHPLPHQWAPPTRVSLGAGGPQGRGVAVPSATSLPVTAVWCAPPQATRGGEPMAGPPWWGQGVSAPQGVPTVSLSPPPTSHKNHTGWRDRGPAVGRVEGQVGTGGDMGQGEGIGGKGEGGGREEGGR